MTAGIEIKRNKVCHSVIIEARSEINSIATPSKINNPINAVSLN